MMPIELWPICAICNKKVDDIKLEDDYMADKIVITVKCHNDFETMSLDRNFVIHNHLDKGFAFTTKRLPDNKDQMLISFGDGMTKCQN